MRQLGSNYTDERRNERKWKERREKNVLVNDKTLNLICLRGAVNPISKDLVWPLVQLSLLDGSFKSQPILLRCSFEKTLWKSRS